MTTTRPSASECTSFNASWWVVLGAFALGGGMVAIGWEGVRNYEGSFRATGFLLLAGGLLLFGLVQLRITVAPRQVRIRHLLWTRAYDVREIAHVGRVITEVDTDGGSKDRVVSVLMRLRDRREVTLRPEASQADALVESIEEVRRQAATSERPSDQLEGNP